MCFLAGLQPSTASAQILSGQGRIEIQRASLSESAAGWQLVASADIQLSPEMRQGLNSGVPLQFIVDFRIRRSRNYWLDETVLKYQHRHTLTYYELTRHYRLQSLTTGESGNYRSLLAALERLGRLQGVVVQKPGGFEGGGSDNVGSERIEYDNDGFDKDWLEKNTQLYGQLSVRLDDKALPLPLRSLLSPTWKLASGDFTWSLN